MFQPQAEICPLESAREPVSAHTSIENARKHLGWEPKVGFDELVKIMVDADMVIAKEEKAVAEHQEKVRRGEA